MPKSCLGDVLPRKTGLIISALYHFFLRLFGDFKESVIVPILWMRCQVKHGMTQMRCRVKPGMTKWLLTPLRLNTTWFCCVLGSHGRIDSWQITR